MHEALDVTPATDGGPRRRRMVKLALAGVVVAGALATSGVAHAGYRWKRVAPAVTTTTTPKTTTTAPKAPTTTVGTDVAVEGYRWG